MRAAARPADSGLTLLELVICLVMLSVLGLLALPDLRAQMDRQRLRSAAQALAGDITEARFLAAQRRQDVHVLGRSGSPWCWTVAVQAGCDCTPAAACSVHRVDASDHARVRLMADFDLRLNPGGQASNGVSTTLESARGERLRLDVSLQGRPRLCAPQGHWSQMPAC
jgi:type IV fimbrial biogenesis protein FimT